jgi:hypothetical protein
MPREARLHPNGQQTGPASCCDSYCLLMSYNPAILFLCQCHLRMCQTRTFAALYRPGPGVLRELGAATGGRPASVPNAARRYARGCRCRCSRHEHQLTSQV